MRRRVCALLLAGLGMSCAASPRQLPPPPPQPRLLTEAQAILAIQEALIEAGALAERTFALRLPDGRPLEADLRFGRPPFAIEWTTRAERAQLGDALPESGQGNPLRIVSAEADGQSVQVLILDAEAYAYEGEPVLVQRGAPGIEDAELRVRRDVSYFVDYVRDQGGQP